MEQVFDGTMESIFGQRDKIRDLVRATIPVNGPMDEESCHAAATLFQEITLSALCSSELWDGRLSPRTIADRYDREISKSIATWCVDHGIDCDTLGELIKSFTQKDPENPERDA